MRALFDFGCYGDNLMRWLMDARRPLAGTAITEPLPPAVYPRVDDEATILLEYPHVQGIIPALGTGLTTGTELEVASAMNQRV